MKKKFLACMVAACAVCASAALFAGCGEEEKEPGGGPEGSGDGPAKVEWQFTGEYHGLIGNGFDFFLLGQMYEGGEGEIYLATWNNGNVAYEVTELAWEEATDRDGLTTFSVSTEDPDATFTETSLYAESDGSVEWEYKFEFAGGYSRTVTFTGTKEAEYDSLDAWKTYVTENGGKAEVPEPDVPEKDAILTFAGGEGNSIEFYANGTAKISAYGGAIGFEYTWTCEDGVITMTSVSNPSEVITSTAEGGVTTIVYAASLGGNNVELTFTCGDISALEDVEVKTELLAFNGDDGAKITFYSDGTAAMTAYGGAINFEYTWTCEDGVITMTSVSNPSEVITSTAEGGVTTIVYAASLGGNEITLTFTSNDIAALEQ